MWALLFWGYFMSDASYQRVRNFPKINKSLLLSTRMLPDMVSTVFPDTYWGCDISCQIPEAYFRHEISPQMILWIKLGKFMSNARSLFLT